MAVKKEIIDYVEQVHRYLKIGWHIRNAKYDPQCSRGSEGEIFIVHESSTALAQILLMLLNDEVDDTTRFKGRMDKLLTGDIKGCECGMGWCPIPKKK